jgi:hypothetical protein
MLRGDDKPESLRSASEATTWWTADRGDLPPREGPDEATPGASARRGGRAHRARDRGSYGPVAEAKVPAPLWFAGAVPAAGRRRRPRALSDRLRARALVLGLRPTCALEEAAAALASEADGNHAALRRAMRGLPIGGDVRSPAAQWAASALSLAIAHAKWSTYDDTVADAVSRSYQLHPSRGSDLPATGGYRRRRSDASVPSWLPSGEPGEPA